MYCKNCWSNLPDGTDVCSKCNTPLSVTTSSVEKAEEAGQESEPKKQAFEDRKPKTGIAIIGVLGGIIIIFFAFIFYRGTLLETGASRTGQGGIDKAAEDAMDNQPVPSTKITVALQRNPDVAVEDINATDPMVKRHIKDGKDFLSSGKYQNAVESFKMALERDSLNLDIRKAISATYGLIAGKKAKIGNYKDAVEDFKNAIKYFDEDPKIYLAMGSAYLLLNKKSETAEALNRATALDPNLVEAYHLLAELYYKNDEIARAIPYWEKVLSLDPSDQKARYFLSKARREKDTNERFTKEAASHFTIRFEGHEERSVGRVVLSILEDAYREIGREFSAYPDSDIVVYLYTKQQFRDITRSPSWTGALFDGMIRVPVGGYKNEFNSLKRSLYHEYTHALIQSIVKKGRCPTWLHEGLAQHFEDKDMSDYRRELISALKKNRVIVPVKNLEGSFMGFNSFQAQIAYSLSLSIVEFMIDRYGMYNVKRILEELSMNKTIEEAFSDGLTISYEQFQKEWQEKFEKIEG